MGLIGNVAAELTKLEKNFPQVTFEFQLGLIRDRVTADSGELTLKSLKSLAADFVVEKCPQNTITRLPERILLFRHDYGNSNILMVREMKRITFLQKHGKVYCCIFTYSRRVGETFLCDLTAVGIPCSISSPSLRFVPVSLSLFLSLSFSLSLFLSLSLSLSLYFPLSLSLSLSFSPFLSLSIFLFLTLFLIGLSGRRDSRWEDCLQGRKFCGHC